MTEHPAEGEISMTREELKDSGLLVQYVLGLLNVAQRAEVERLVEGDPFLEEELERLRGELDSYADARTFGPPPEGRTPRTAEDFRDLDHEMITAMMERNHTLNIWRYVMVGICLLLVGVCGYLFRLKEATRGELVTERAVHAQDVASYEQDLTRSRQAIQAAATNWEDVQTLHAALDTGTLHVHLLLGADIALVDLSDAPKLPEGQAYYVFSYTDSAPSVGVEVNARQLAGLLPVGVALNHTELRVYRWGEHLVDPTPEIGEQPLAALALPPE